MEDAHRRFERVLVDAHHVEVLGPLGHDLLALARHPQRVEPVAQPRGALEVEVLGRLLHLGQEPALHVVGVAGQERHEVGHHGVVALVVHRPDARARAPLDVEQQAGLAQLGVPLELAVRAGAHLEGAQQKVEGVADGAHVRVGAEVAHLGPAPAPDHRRPRPLVGEGHRQRGVRLVVDQPDVEAGPVPLDEGVLEEDGLDLVGDLDPLDVVGHRHHLGRAGRQGGGVGEVVAQPAAQGLGLAHVQDPPLARRGTGRSPECREWSPEAVACAHHYCAVPHRPAVRPGAHRA